MVGGHLQLNSFYLSRRKFWHLSNTLCKFTKSISIVGKTNMRIFVTFLNQHLMAYVIEQWGETCNQWANGQVGQHVVDCAFAFNFSFFYFNSMEFVLICNHFKKFVEIPIIIYQVIIGRPPSHKNLVVKIRRRIKSDHRDPKSCTN